MKQAIRACLVYILFTCALFCCCMHPYIHVSAFCARQFGSAFKPSYQLDRAPLTSKFRAPDRVAYTMALTHRKLVSHRKQRFVSQESRRANTTPTSLLVINHEHRLFGVHIYPRCLAFLCLTNSRKEGRKIQAFHDDDSLFGSRLLL